MMPLRQVLFPLLLLALPACTALQKPTLTQTSAPISPGGIQVVSAVYGSGTKFADVTERTRELVSRDEPFYASPQWLQADPTPGWNKAFVTIYHYKGHRYIHTAGENGKVSEEILLRTTKR